MTLSWYTVVLQEDYLKNGLLSISDLNREDISELISDAVGIKMGEQYPSSGKKVMALLFEKPSLRTRVSFEVAMGRLGGQTIYLSPAEVGLGERESIPDVARVLSRYVDVIAARTFSHRALEVLAAYSNIPVINALSDLEHPCQALADLVTIYEKKGKLEGLNLAYVGDGNNVAHSLLLAAALTGMNIKIASPDGYAVQEKILKRAQDYARTSGAQILNTEQTGTVFASSYCNIHGLWRNSLII